MEAGIRRSGFAVSITDHACKWRVAMLERAIPLRQEGRTQASFPCIADACTRIRKPCARQAPNCVWWQDTSQIEVRRCLHPESGDGLSGPQVTALGPWVLANAKSHHAVACSGIGTGMRRGGRHCSTGASEHEAWRVAQRSVGGWPAFRVSSRRVCAQKWEFGSRMIGR